MRRSRRFLSLAALGLAATAVVAPLAGAHGDLASEYLQTHDAFLPQHARIPSNVVAVLAAALGQAEHLQIQVKVALIARPADLGARTNFFRKPQAYADWVTEDIYSDYHGGLLVVMPNGYGGSIGGAPDPRLQRAFLGLAPAGGNPAEMVRVATTAVQRLAANSGHMLRLPQTHAAAGGRSSKDRIKIAAILLALLAVGAVATFIRRRLRARTAGEAGR